VASLGRDGRHDLEDEVLLRRLVRMCGSRWLSEQGRAKESGVRRDLRGRECSSKLWCREGERRRRRRVGGCCSLNMSCWRGKEIAVLESRAPWAAAILIQVLVKSSVSRSLTRYHRASQGQGGRVSKRNRLKPVGGCGMEGPGTGLSNALYKGDAMTESVSSGILARLIGRDP
jgi:hypothetical protein